MKNFLIVFLIGIVIGLGILFKIDHANSQLQVEYYQCQSLKARWERTEALKQVDKLIEIITRLQTSIQPLNKKPIRSQQDARC